MREVPALPLFVEIITTPLEPLAPYIAVALASFNISIDSISAGLIEAKPFSGEPATAPPFS